VNSAARLEVQNAGALGGTSSGTTVSNGGALSLYQANGGITIADEALNLSGVGVSEAGVNKGALRNTGGNNTWNGAITLGADTRINADTSGSSGSLTIGGNISGGSNVLFMGAQGAEGKTGGNINVSGVISGSGGAYNSTTTSIYKDGAGTLTLSGANTYFGATAVNAGLLKVVSGGSISSSSTTVNNGGALDVGGTAGTVQVNSGGLLKGSGSAGAVTLQSGSFLNPGDSPGTLTAASAIISGGSTYNWEISRLTGTAGTDWDLFSVGGLLNMSGVTSANKWNLVVTGDSGFAGWTDTSSYSYVFAQAASVSGFSSTVGTDVTSLFNITTAPGITSKPNSSFNPNGDFKVVVGSSNGNTTLNLMAVPEPSSGSLLLAGIGSLIVLRRFRKKA
jgi:autotransporter-associated beta strand protein